MLICFLANSLWLKVVEPDQKLLENKNFFPFTSAQSLTSVGAQEMLLLSEYEEGTCFTELNGVVRSAELRVPPPPSLWPLKAEDFASSHLASNLMRLTLFKKIVGEEAWKSEQQQPRQLLLFSAYCLQGTLLNVRRGEALTSSHRWSKGDSRGKYLTRTSWLEIEEPRLEPRWSDS